MGEFSEGLASVGFFAAYESTSQTEINEILAGLWFLAGFGTLSTGNPLMLMGL